ncbi:CpsD/CapB family tyrosine-protein kinase [Caballeronia sp. SL2Y3]|uniref:tyrosine-protein kinase family protein n=1 Tax=Caballeronia sp. SL2Y3 TaxID=2878151 RepID=UPI001FD387D8|nr:CpsD/CapB family tyrosine-protein kinase [Caballeronia sp. SL2Y3]
MYSKIVSILFYMFFTCIIFNPRVNGFTIYFYLFIPFLDIKFLRFLSATVRSWSGPLAIGVAVSAIGSPSVALRVVSIAVCIGYMMYTIGARICYLHHWMAINVAFAVVQFAAYYVDRGLAETLGPAALSRMIWGEYATRAYSNFYEFLFFARASGFSREAGFFSSLLVASLIAHLLIEKVNKKIVAMYCLGLFLCFSKSSFILFIFLGLYPLRHRLRMVHPLVMLAGFVCVVGLVGIYLGSHTFYGSTTFSHRLGGYPFMFDASLEDVLRGVTADDVRSRYMYMPSFRLVEYEISSGVPFAGLPASFAEMGLFSALLLLGFIAFTASDGFLMLLLLLITSTVSITTVTSFVVIGYLVLYWPRFAAYRAKRNSFPAASFKLFPLEHFQLRRRERLRLPYTRWKRNVMIVTSSRSNPGKTVLAAQLASMNAKAGNRVLLVDADFRQGAISDSFGLSDSLGLAQVLDRNIRVQHVIHRVEGFRNLDVIPVGDLLPHPNLSLYIGRLSRLVRELTSYYDLVIIDTPEVLSADDACLITPLGACTLLVEQPDSHAAGNIQEAVRRLDRVRANIAGVVFDAMPRHAPPTTRQRYGHVDHVTP